MDNAAELISDFVILVFDFEPSGFGVAAFQQIFHLFDGNVILLKASCHF